MAGAVWIDVTEIFRWRGPVSGIQRVIVEIGRHLDERMTKRFFVYDYRRGQCYEVGMDALDKPGSGEPVAQSPWIARTRLGAKLDYRLHRLAGTAGRPLNGAPQARFGRGDTILFIGSTWNRQKIIGDLAACKAQSGFRIVHMIYDIIPLVQPQVCTPDLVEKFGRYMDVVVRTSDGLLSISEHTSRDLEAYCVAANVPQPPTAIVRNGDFSSESLTCLQPPVDMAPGSFLLCVGTIESRKNPMLLYFVYKLAALRGIDLPPLVMVGRKGLYATDLFEQIRRDPETNDKIMTVSGISDAQLQWLYRNCRFTVYPSVYEGWGLPIGESLKYGKLCLASSTSSMTEIAGDIIDYYDPFDPDQALKLIVRYLDDATLAAKERDIHERYRATSWSETAHQVEQFIATF